MARNWRDHERGDRIKWVIIFLAVIVLAVAVTAGITKGFKDWNPYGWFGKKTAAVQVEQSPAPSTAVASNAKAAENTTGVDFVSTPANYPSSGVGGSVFYAKLPEGHISTVFATAEESFAGLCEGMNNWKTTGVYCLDAYETEMQIYIDVSDNWFQQYRLNNLFAAAGTPALDAQMVLSLVADVDGYNMPYWCPTDAIPNQDVTDVYKLMFLSDSGVEYTNHSDFCCMDSTTRPVNSESIDAYLALVHEANYSKVAYDYETPSNCGYAWLDACNVYQVYDNDGHPFASMADLKVYLNGETETPSTPTGETYVGAAQACVSGAYYVQLNGVDDSNPNRLYSIILDNAGNITTEKQSDHAYSVVRYVVTNAAGSKSMTFDYADTSALPTDKTYAAGMCLFVWGWTETPNQSYDGGTRLSAGIRFTRKAGYGLPTAPTVDGYTFSGWATDAAGAQPCTDTVFATATDLYPVYTRADSGISTPVMDEIYYFYDMHGDDSTEYTILINIDEYGIVRATKPSKPLADDIVLRIYDDITDLTSTAVVNPPQYVSTILEEKRTADLVECLDMSALTMEKEYNIGWGPSNRVFFKVKKVPGLVLPESPTKEGHTFTGWYSDAACTQLVTRLYVTENMILYAGWKANQHIVTLLPENSTSLEPLTVDWGTVPELPELTRTGYDFVGWYNGDTLYENTPIKGDVTLTAHWTIKRFTVTFMDGNTVYKQITVDWGTRLDTAAAATSLTGYHLVKDGVRMSKDTLVTENVTVDLVSMTKAEKFGEFIGRYWWLLIVGGGLVMVLSIAATVAIMKRR